MNNLDEYEKAFFNVLSEEPSNITLLYQFSSIPDIPCDEKLYYLIRDAVNTGTEKKYPISFSYFLVLVGIGHYKGGEFWPAVWGILNLIQKHSRQTDWGNLFLEVIKKYKLPKFEDEKALKYITPILGHGGIPNYCLPDFFAYYQWRDRCNINRYWGDFAGMEAMPFSFCSSG
jgi:hypothetical protein